VKSVDEQVEEMVGKDRLFRRWVVKVLLAALFAVYFGAAAPERPIERWDAPLYVGLAQSLANGEGYSFNLEPHVWVPPVYPATLSLVIRACGENYLAMNLLSVLAAFVAFLGIWTLIEKISGDARMGAIVAILSAGTLNFLLASCATLTDMPYLAFMSWAFVAAFHWIRDRRILCLSCVGCIVLSVLAYLTRYVGVTVIGGVSLGLLLTPDRGVRGKRAWKKLLVYVILILLPISAWHIRNHVVAPPGADKYHIGSSWQKVTPAETDSLDTMYSASHPGLMLNSYRILWGLGRNMAYMPGKGVRVVPFALGTMSLLFLLASLRRGYSVIAFHCLMLGGIYVALSRPLDRYFLPLAPFGVYYLLTGVRSVCAWVQKRRKEQHFLALVLLGLIGAVIGILRYKGRAPVLWWIPIEGLVAIGVCAVCAVVLVWLHFASERMRATFLRNGFMFLAIIVLVWNFVCIIPKRVGKLNNLSSVPKGYITGLEWVRANSDSDDAVLGYPRLVHQVTRRKWVPLHVSEKAEHLWDRIVKENIRFVVVDIQVPEVRETFVPTLKLLGDRVVLRRHFGHVQVYEVERDGKAAGRIVELIAAQMKGN